MFDLMRLTGYGRIRIRTVFSAVVYEKDHRHYVSVEKYSAYGDEHCRLPGILVAIR